MIDMGGNRREGRELLVFRKGRGRGSGGGNKVSLRGGGRESVRPPRVA